jgi:hypothetical protein
MLLEKKNFLPATEFNASFGTIKNSNTFPWFYSKNTAYDDNRIDEEQFNLWDFSFSNTLYIDGAPTSFVGEKSAELLVKICDCFGLTLKEILRIRIGLITKTPENVIHNAHIDFEEPHHTALFYLTTCNGPTILYNQLHPDNIIFTEKEKIFPEENKVVVFNGLQYHASTSQTDTKQRIVINFNFKVAE